MLTYKDMAIKYGVEQQAVIDRFKSKLKKLDDGCIIYTGGMFNKTGRYGCFNIYIDKKNYSVKAHRFAYALEHGFTSLPRGYRAGKDDNLTINHKCHNRMCCNPEHLEILTLAENSKEGSEYAKRN